MAKKKPKNFIKDAIKHPGALRDKAMKAHLIGNSGKLSESDLADMEKMAKDEGDHHMMQQVNLARVLRNMKHGKKK